MLKLTFVFMPMALALVAANSQAQVVSAPDLKEGDSWVLEYTQEVAPSTWNQIKRQITVVRVNSKNMLISNKQPDANQPGRETLINKDWSEFSMIDGVETITYQPMLFPLSVGKTWETKFTRPHPAKDIKSAAFVVKYTVIGLEDVTVKAGTYKALKIEGEGTWTDESEPVHAVLQGAKTSTDGTSMSTVVSNQAALKRAGRLYRVIWYSPDQKRWVKNIEEQYAPDGTRYERKTLELLSTSLKNVAGGGKSD